MLQPQESVSAVIPAFNEDDHIGTVLEVLRAVDLLETILVVDDASTDNTRAVVAQYAERDPRIRLLPLANNLGKGGAMVAGAEALPEDLILFLDADLIRVRPEHIEALCAPVCWGECDMTVARFTHGRRQTDLSHRLAPFLSGQRCLRWSLFRDAPELGQSRWGAEVALSLHAWQNGYRVQRVDWRGVTHAMRMEKQPKLLGYWSHVLMWIDIGRYFGRYFVFRRLLPKPPLSRVSADRTTDSGPKRKRRASRPVSSRRHPNPS